MDSFINTLNHWGGRFADFALPMLVQSSLLIVLLFALDLVLRNRVRAVVRYALWMLVLIKLVLPPSFAAPTGLAYWLPEKKAVKTLPAPSPQFVVRYSDVKFDEARPLPSLPPPRAKLQFAGWLLLGWLATAVGLMAWLVRRSRSVVQTAARALPASESPEQLLDACRQQMGIRQRVRVKLSANAGSPAVCGLWRPVILIPQQLAYKLSALQLRAVLLHELAHIKRGDVWVHYAQTLLQICYWWHPLLWLANAQIRRVRELAVDEAVVVAMGSEAEAYPATLLEVARLALHRPALALGLIGIVESKSTLAQRIQRLLDRPVPKSAKLGFTRLAAVALIGAVLLPMARGERKPGALAAASTPRSLSYSAAIEVEVKFVSLTDAALANLLGFRPKTIAASGHFVWTLSPAERIELLQRMERQPDAATLSAPRVTTTTAREAQMAVDGIQPFLHPRAHTSAACQVIPYQIGSSLDLAVSAKITESGDVGPAFGDDLSRNQKEDTNDARSGAKSNQVYAVNAVGYINYDVGTAHTLVGDGGAVILQNPAITGADGRRILVVVSPRIVRQSASVIEPNTNAISVAASPSASNPSRDAIDAPRTPPTNSPKSQPTDTVTSSEGQGATKRFASSTGQNVEIEAIKQTEIQSALNRIVLPEIVFDDVPLPEALQWLANEAGDRDPEGKGVVFLVNPNFIGPAPQTTVDPNTGEPVTLPPPEPLDMNNVIVRINPPLKNVRLADALEAIVKVADKPIRYWVEDESVVFAWKSSEIAQLETRIFKVDPRTFIESLGRRFPDRATNDVPGLIKDFFTASGVNKLPPIFYKDRTGVLLVRATAEELDRVHKAIDALNAAQRNESGAKPRANSPTGERTANADADEDSGIAAESAAWARTYVCGEFRLTLDTDGTYLASLEEDGIRHTETGTWKRKGREFILERKAGDLQYAIRRLRVDERNPRHLLWVPEVMVPFGAIDYFAFKPADEAPAASNRNERTETEEPTPDNPSAALETRIYKLDLYVLRRNLQKLNHGASVGDGSSSLSDLVRKFMQAHNVTFQAPKTMFLNEQTGALLVRSTSEELEIVQRVVMAMNTGKVAEDLGFLPPVNQAMAAKPTQADPDAALVTRTYRLNSTAFLQALQRGAETSRISESTNAASELLRGFLAAAGVRVTPPNKVFFNHRTGVLMLRASAQELDLAQKAIEVLNFAPPQVTIEAKFMELPTDAVKKLGLDLPPPVQTARAWSRILTAAQMQAVLHAAGQTLGVDILSAPKVTTLSGRQTQIQAVKIKTIVNGIAPEALAPPGVQSTNGVPAQPYLTSQVPSGPTLDVVPYVGADGYTIHLAALPQVTELLRYDTTLNGANETRVWVDGKQRNVPMPRLRIRTCQMQASVDVYDGQTLVLGAPTVTQVLQQSNGQSVTNAIAESPGKRLLVFITPTIIDPAGNPIHIPGKEPFPADKPPPQQAQ